MEKESCQKLNGKDLLLPTVCSQDSVLKEIGCEGWCRYVLSKPFSVSPFFVCWFPVLHCCFVVVGIWEFGFVTQPAYKIWYMWLKN